MRGKPAALTWVRVSRLPDGSRPKSGEGAGRHHSSEFRPRSRPGATDAVTCHNADLPASSIIFAKT